MAKTAAQIAQDKRNAAYFAAYYAAHPELSHPTLPTATGAFTPFTAPTEAPPGSYDPAYKAQQDNANIGFGYAAQDYGTQQARTANDYAQAQGYLGQDRTSALADLLTARTRGQQDATTATTDLSRNYGNLATAQAGQQRAAGVGEGGALAQAMQKRQANQGVDQSRIDTSLGRLLQDNTTATDRTNQSYDRQGAALDTSYFRGNTDLNTNFSRAGQMNDAFNRQSNTEQLYIAGQNGGLPVRPSNEYGAAGHEYRIEVHNGKRYHRLPNGDLVSSKQAAQNTRNSPYLQAYYAAHPELTPPSNLP